MHHSRVLKQDMEGQPGERIEGLREPEKEGLNQIMFLPTLELQHRVLEHFARQVIERY